MAKQYFKVIKIANISLPDKPLLLAPMEDVTDQAFRIICKRLGADLVFTEFVNSEGLVRNSLKTKKKMPFCRVLCGARRIG